MKRFILHWKYGDPQTVEGNDIADACNRAGIGAGALPALDWYEEVHSETVDPFDKSFENQYRLAKSIGDKRYGSECKHEIVRNGVCDICRRRVR